MAYRSTAPQSTQSPQAPTVPTGRTGYRPLAQEPEPEKKPGFIKSLVQDVARPFARVAVGGYNALKGENINTPRNVPGLGETKGLPEVIKPTGFFSPEGKLQNPIDFKGFGQAAGIGAEITSNVVGGFGAKNVVKQGFSGAVKKAAITGVKEGATSGLLYGAGSGIQKDDATIGSVVKDTALGLGAGALGGGLIGSVGGAGSYGVRRVAEKVSPKLADSRIASQAVEISVRNKKALQELEDSNSVIRRATTKAKEKGIDSKDLLSQTDLLLDAVDDTGTIRTLNARQELDDFIKPQEGVIRKNLEREGKTMPLQVVRTKLLTALGESGLQGEALDNAYRKVEAELAGYARKADQAGNVPLAMVHDAKVDKYSNINYMGDPAVKKADKIIAKTLKKIVEDTTESVDAQALNRELSQHYAVLNLLEKLDGKKVAGGKLGKYFSQTLGSIVGSHFGPLGSIAGAELGGRLQGASMASTFSKKSGKGLVQSPAMKSAVELGNSPLSPLEQAQRATKTAPKMLPSPRPGSIQSSVFQPIPMGEGTTFEPRAKQVNYSNNFGSRNQHQTKTIIPTSNDIKQSIPLNKGNVKLDDITPPKPLKRLPGGGAQVMPAFGGLDKLSTRLVEKLKGHTTVSKQFISDMTNATDLKQAEKDLIRNVLSDEGETVVTKEFADKVKTHLLPLEPSHLRDGRYESVTLPDDLRGPVGDYTERIYSSPIKTSAGDVHYSGDYPNANYFAHSRIEDLPEGGNYRFNPKTGESNLEKPGSTRRVIEIQSDLFQKGRSDVNRQFKAGDIVEYNGKESTIRSAPLDGKLYIKGKLDAVPVSEIRTIKDYESKVLPYRNTWHERIIREEVKQAAVDGKTKLQFPTGETAMKIEGLGAQNEANARWQIDLGDGYEPLKPELLKVGKEIAGDNGGSDWIITDVIGDGKFKAVPKEVWEANGSNIKKMQNDFVGNQRQETFDISGKVDSNNPIYKFYEKEVGRYLKNKYKAELITDPQGVTWWQLNVDKEQGRLPVEAFAFAPVAASMRPKDQEQEPKKKSVFGSNTIKVDNSPIKSFNDQFVGGQSSGQIPGFRSNKIIAGYDIGSYATDPNHERNIAKIYSGIGEIASAQDIHDYIKAKAPTSPISGDYVIQAAQEFKVNPKLLMAIMQQDSSFGSRGKAVRTRNPGNVGNDDTGRTVTFKSWLDGVRAVARNLAKRKV